MYIYIYIYRTSYRILLFAGTKMAATREQLEFSLRKASNGRLIERNEEKLPSLPTLNVFWSANRKINDYSPDSLNTFPSHPRLKFTASCSLSICISHSSPPSMDLPTFISFPFSHRSRVPHLCMYSHRGTPPCLAPKALPTPSPWPHASPMHVHSTIVL